MNFYDKVHEMVSCLKKTEEYITYMKLKEDLKKDPALYEKVKDFKQKQREQHMKYISGEKISEEENQSLQNIYSLLIQKEIVTKFFESEIKLDVLLADIQKILGDGIKDIVEF